MAKRGESGLSLVVGIDKPEGMTSHDVVNRVRRVFGERRVGHTGTLDPLATGALVVCVGPATRLDSFFTNHDKRYAARIVFGTATDTDDCTGGVVQKADVPDSVRDEDEADRILKAFTGPQMQVPPLYSAIKRDGVKAYEAARKGQAVDVEPRSINVYDAHLIALGETDEGDPFWDVVLSVSKGTYIRALARDIGIYAGTAAHIGALRRFSSGLLDIRSCVNLEELADLKLDAALDPVPLLGFPVLQLNARQLGDVRNGKKLFVNRETIVGDGVPNRMVSLVTDQELVAIYTANAEYSVLTPSCVFSQGVIRGTYRKH